MKILFLTKRKIGVLIGALMLAVIAYMVGSYFWGHQESTSTFSWSDQEEERVINLVTGEFKAETAAGQELEVYRWDPGTIFVEKGEPFKLSISGVKGKEHPFMIEGTEVKGVVEQGKEKVVDLQFDEEGVYRLLCETHTSLKSSGPMVAYIVVD